MEFMLFRKLLPVFAAAAVLSSLPARAQFGVYGEITGQRFGGITCPTFAAPCAAGGGHAQNYGGTFGAFYDIRDIGPVKLGADVRGEVFTSNKRADSSAGGAGIFRQYDVLGGVRATVATPISWLRPYAEIAVGYTRNNASGTYTQTTTVNNTLNPPTTFSSVTFNPLVYANQPLIKGLIGADIHVSPHFEIRAIELGLGEALGSTTTVVATTNTVSASGTTSTSTTLASSPDTHGIASVGAGVVFRFP